MKNMFFVILCFTSLACKKSAIENIAPIVPPIALENTKITFDKNIKSILAIQCTPCHMPGGDRINKWDTFSKTKTFYSDIVIRIQKKVTDDGFMPKNGKKMDQSDINIILKWEKDGFLEK